MTTIYKPLQITPSLLTQYEPNGNMGVLSQFVFYRTYSRWLENLNRREYWTETSKRAAEYNINLGVSHLEKYNLNSDTLQHIHQKDLDLLYSNMVELKQLTSGRTLWIGGTDVSYDHPMANFNCSAMILDSWEKLTELFYLGMIGAGIGVRILRDDVAKMSPLKYISWILKHKPYNPHPENKRVKGTHVKMCGAEAVLTVGDSKEGWVDALGLLLRLMRGDLGPFGALSVDYNNIRPAGSRIKRFGGRAGGPDPLRQMLNKCHHIFSDQSTPLYDTYPKLCGGRPKPIHILDLINAIAYNIHSGGMRTIAIMALLDQEDEDTINAKANIVNNPMLMHRHMSNNSIFYIDAPSAARIAEHMKMLRFVGEPGFVNAKKAKARYKKFAAVNPCAETLLADRGLCNLMTINVMAFVKDGWLDNEGLIDAMGVAVRSGVRMTLPKLELPEWDKVQQKERLLGVSLTGWQDMVGAVNMSVEHQKLILRMLRDYAHVVAQNYCDALHINKPQLITTLKPEGTSSQLMGGVSNGLHMPHASSYIRRIRLNRHDPLAKTVFDLGWRIHAEYNVNRIQQMGHLFGDINVRDIKHYTYERGHLSVRVAVDTIADIGHTTEYLKARLCGMFGCADNMVSVWATIGGDIVATVATSQFEHVFGNIDKIVIDFPIVATAKKTLQNTSAIEQLEIYKLFLDCYTDHNPSNTVAVRGDEWNGVVDWMQTNWDDIVAVSFIDMDSTVYPLMPFEAVSEIDAQALADSMANFNPELLMQYDRGEDISLSSIDECQTGVCPIK